MNRLGVEESQFCTKLFYESMPRERKVLWFGTIFFFLNHCFFNLLRSGVVSTGIVAESKL